METTTISRAASTIDRGSVSQPTQRHSRRFLSPSDTISNAETRLGSAHSNESDGFKGSLDFMGTRLMDLIVGNDPVARNMEEADPHNGRVSMRDRVMQKLERLKSRLQNLVRQMTRH
ncbi:hypothetical protein V2G26_020272 [Clonostachys chloroleuca]